MKFRESRRFAANFGAFRRVLNPVGLGVAVGAALLVTLTFLPKARGEIVYENEVDQGPAEIRTRGAADPRGEDRQMLRQAITSSEKANATRQMEMRVNPAPRSSQPELPQPVLAQPQQMVQPQVAQVVEQARPVAAPVQQVAPAQLAVGEAALASTEPQSVAVENLSKTELMRRERVREELRNEDVIQERLEQLRLRDERRRGDQILKGSSALPAEQVLVQPGVAPLQQEAVVAPITERPGQPAQYPVVAAAPLQQNQGINPALQNTTVGDQLMSTASAESLAKSEDLEKTVISVHPYAGMSSMNVNSTFDVKPHYTVGAGVGISSTENVSFELGYTFSEYGVQLAGSSNPLVYQAQSLQQWQGYASPETIAMKQNVLDAGLKLSLLGSSARIRPFLGGGAAYSKSYVNYTEGYTSILEQYGQAGQARDYESSAFLGYVSTGFDVKLSKSVTLGGQFKYYGVLSSRENDTLNYNGFITNPNPMIFGAPDSDKRAVGASLAQSSFYSILGSASFVF